MINKESLFHDFSPFSDIGSGPIKISEKNGTYTLKVAREGRELKIKIEASSGATKVAHGKNEKSYKSISQLLSSEYFANLKNWASAQKELLQQNLPSNKKNIPLNSKTHLQEKKNSIEEIDSIVNAPIINQNSTRIILIDGPAGIGKTNLIEQLAFLRANHYKEKGLPLLLHVKSRGRVLSNLQDLMAFSLQTIRSTTTYDQIPVLIKHGLIVIAIDGFDELGDPNGYDLAWAQLAELVDTVRGNGTLILAGRDTFFSRSTLIRDVKAIKEHVDDIISITILPPTPDQATEWLKKHQWTDQGLNHPAVSILLEENSFALRPVFLKLLAEKIKHRDLHGKPSNYLVPMLIDYIIKREATLFGAPAISSMSLEKIEKFLWSYMYEVARDMADSQTEALDRSSLGWLAEVALDDEYEQEIVSLIKNRAVVMALLVADERPNYVTFMHSYIMNYFLSLVSIDTLGNGDIPKFIRRNLLASEFLSVFSDTSSYLGASEPEKINKFFFKSINFSHVHLHADRGIRNVGALLLSSLPEFPKESCISISDYQVDDVVARGTAAEAKIERTTINRLDSRGADLSALSFSETKVIKLIANSSSRFPSSFPPPKFIIDEDGDEIVDDEKIKSWLESHGASTTAPSNNGIVSQKLASHPIYSLLGKACRLRQYWLRAENDIYASRILDDEHWPTLYKVLKKHGFLREEERPAAGRATEFFHIKQKEKILSEDASDESIANFFEELSDSI